LLHLSVFSGDGKLRRAELSESIDCDRSCDRRDVAALPWDFHPSVLSLSG